MYGRALVCCVRQGLGDSAIRCLQVFIRVAAVSCVISVMLIFLLTFLFPQCVSIYQQVYWSVAFGEG